MKRIIYFISILGDVQLKDEEAQKHLSIFRDYTKKKEELLKENLESKLKKFNKKQSKNVQKMSAIPSLTHKNVEKEVDEPSVDEIRNHYRNKVKINGVESKIAKMPMLKLKGTCKLSLILFCVPPWTMNHGSLK